MPQSGLAQMHLRLNALPSPAHHNLLPFPGAHQVAPRPHAPQPLRPGLHIPPAPGRILLRFLPR